MTDENRLSTGARAVYAAARRNAIAQSWPFGTARAALDKARAWDGAAPETRKNEYGGESIWRATGGNSSFHMRGPGRVQWIENPESVGLRLVGLAHEVDSSLGHTGWHLDSDGMGETVAGVVYRLPGAKGRARYLAGYADPFNCDKWGRGPALLSLNVLTGEPMDSSRDSDPVSIDAARRGDGMAESMAEQEREYQDAWRAGREARELAQEALQEGRAMITHCRDLRALWAARRGAPGLPRQILTESIRATVAALRAARGAYESARKTARDYRDENRPGRYCESVLNGFHNGYQEGV